MELAITILLVSILFVISCFVIPLVIGILMLPFMVKVKFFSDKKNYYDGR